MVRNFRLAGYIFLFFAAFSAVFLYSNYKQTIFWITCFTILYIFCNIFANIFEKNTELLNIEEDQYQTKIDEDRDVFRRENAVKYCANLIEYYKASQRLNRICYYIVQLSTIIFSGITPVLIVISTNSTNNLLPYLDIIAPWAKWLSIILPALAAILASISTSIPLQRNWISSKITKENLEAELQAFRLGATDLYRVYDATDSNEKKRKQKVLDNFIDRVNKIHLQEVTQWAQLQLQKDLQKDNEDDKTVSKTLPLKIISDITDLIPEGTANIKVEPEQSVMWSANPNLGSFHPKLGVKTVYEAPTEEEAKDREGNPIKQVKITATSVDVPNSSSSLSIAIQRND